MFFQPKIFKIIFPSLGQKSLSKMYIIPWRIFQNLTGPLEALCTGSRPSVVEDWYRFLNHNKLFKECLSKTFKDLRCNSDIQVVTRCCPMLPSRNPLKLRPPESRGISRKFPVQGRQATSFIATIPPNVCQLPTNIDTSNSITNCVELVSNHYYQT